MNTASLTAALAIALTAGSLFATNAMAQAPAVRTITLDTVQVRPSAEQLAQREFEAHSAIPTLAAITVRPSVEQEAAFAAERAARDRVVTLAAVQVRPSAEQMAELAANEASTGVAMAQVKRESIAPHAVSDSMAQHLANAVISLPIINLRPALNELKALTGLANAAATR